MRINYFLALTFLTLGSVCAQSNQAQDEFWNQLQSRCGQAFAGKMTTDPIPKDFSGKELAMFVMSCSDTEIKIPFYVGDDHSRTWVFTKTPQGIKLKHDHRLKDGSEDKITQYGGTTTNTGSSAIQYFPADQETADLIPAAAGNVWWVTINGSEYTYNLRRIDSPNHFQVQFDLTKEIPQPQRPWGHE